MPQRTPQKEISGISPRRKIINMSLEIECQKLALCCMANRFLDSNERKIKTNNPNYLTHSEKMPNRAIFAIFIPKLKSKSCSVVRETPVREDLS